MDNKQNDRNGDAGIGDIEGRPGIGEPNVQIKQQKIDHVPIKKTIGKIAQNASEQKRERHVAPDIA